MRTLLMPLTTVVILMVVQAGASVVTSIPGGTVIPIPAIDCSAPLFACFGPGPFTFGPGVTWKSTNAFNNAGSVFGFTAAFSFGGNGIWTGALGPMAGLNDSTDRYGSTDTMTFTFTTPVSAVGGFLNYEPGGSTPTTIAVHDAHGNLIESPFNLTFSTGGNDHGFFFGFKESGPIIKSFTLTDNFIGITNLTTAAIPEPSSLLLITSGLLGVIGFSRRRLGL